MHENMYIKCGYGYMNLCILEAEVLMDWIGWIDRMIGASAIFNARSRWRRVMTREIDK